MVNQSTERVAENVRRLMTSRGVVQAQLAAHLQMSQPAVSRRLTGEVPFDVNELALIAELFSVDPRSLLDDVA